MLKDGKLIVALISFLSLTSITYAEVDEEGIPYTVPKSTHSELHKSSPDMVAGVKKHMRMYKIEDWNKKKASV